MATSSIAGDVFQVTVKAHCLGQEIDNVWYAKLDGSYSPASFGTDYHLMLAIAENMGNAWAAKILPVLATLYKADGVEVKRVGGTASYPLPVLPGDPPKFSKSFTFDYGFSFATALGGLNGGVAAVSINATEDAVSIRLLTTGQPRKRSMGAKRLSGIDDAEMTDNRITAVFANTVKVAMEDLLNQFNTTGITDTTFAMLVVASATNRAAAIVPSDWPIIEMQVYQEIGSQNSRKQKRRYA